MQRFIYSTLQIINCDWIFRIELSKITYETNEQVGQTMFKIKLEGQEGYFLTENEYEQLKNFFNAYEGKVIQNANANNS